MAIVTPSKNITAGGRNFDAGITYSVDDDLAALMAAEEAPETPQEAAQEAPAGPPAQSALKADWVDHAVSQGMDPAEAADSTKDALVEQFGTHNEPAPTEEVPPEAVV